MLFDFIIMLILFQGRSVLFRLIGRRRGDVLYYVSNPDRYWRRRKRARQMVDWRAAIHSLRANWTRNRFAISSARL